MTFKILKQIMNLYDIPEDVELISDSGWECGATDMDGVYYNEEENTIVFTQYATSYDHYFQDEHWKLVYGERQDWDDHWDERMNNHWFI